ncbi:hypothetical protein ROHU_001498 [Labeo rohita]|uniref:Uncharacterized protein n=1 Tax=Labeo rohita TaxID=84645 RepID=A0A498P1H2_LABRO|nr:hypothetical protein ROHU_001498 [Labeo rohita]
MVPVTAAVPPNLERGPGVRRPRVSPQGSGHVKSICISLSGPRCARTQTQTHIRPRALRETPITEFGMPPDPFFGAGPLYISDKHNAK